MKKNLVVEVREVKEYAEKYAYIVAKAVDGKVWFDSAWNSLEDAQRIADELDYGFVLENK